MKSLLIVPFLILLLSTELSPYVSQKTVFQKLNTENILFKLSQRYNVPLDLINAIWEQESNKALRSVRGKTGEYGPFQILEIAAKQVNCKGAWRSTFPRNAECGVRYMKHGVNKCGSFYLHRVATYYNTGTCRKKPNSYGQRVMKRMLKI